MNKSTCAHCHESVDADNIVFIDREDDDFCADCYSDLTFLCEMCGSFEENAYLGKMVMICDPKKELVGSHKWEKNPYADGIYRVIDPDFYWQNVMGEGGLYKDCLQWGAPLPEMSTYPVGIVSNLCEECQNEIDRLMKGD